MVIENVDDWPLWHVRFRHGEQIWDPEKQKIVWWSELRGSFIRAQTVYRAMQVVETFARLEGAIISELDVSEVKEMR